MTVVGVQSVRSRLIDKCLIYLAIIASLPLIGSLSRISEHGWHPIYFLHIALLEP